MKKRYAHCFMVLLALSLVLGLLSAPVYGESKTGVDGASASVRLQFQITIPTILYLQVGTTTGMDTVSCTVNNIPGIGGPLPMLYNGSNNPVPVRVATVMRPTQGASLTADASTGMTGAISGKIPFSKISCTTGGTGGFTGYTFSDVGSTTLNQFTGSGDRNGTYTFAYANDTWYDADTYTGIVTYTLSSP